MDLNINSFILIFSRVLSMLISIPVLGAKNVPKGYKIGLGFFITLILIQVVNIDKSIMPADISVMVMGIGGEFLIGFIIGLLAKLIFTAVDIAGDVMGFQMGFSIVNVIDPQTSSQVPIVGTFQSILCALIFLSINGHHYFLAALAESFNIIPPLRFGLSGDLLNAIVKFLGEIFVLAIKIGAPVMVALLITNVAMSIVSKTMPQMNIMAVGFPITITVGLIIMGLSLPLFAFLIDRVFTDMQGNLLDILSVMRR
ncbi:MAG: flagellar biosynthetic protein FliR [Nitrospirae bacterium]|nr:flagellar biosynthetic protein FliR [Nitrospirota bacterium]